MELAIDIELEVPIDAPPDRVWDCVVNGMAEWLSPPGGQSMKLGIEPRVGGRWYRDLSDQGGDGVGHLWGHVQVFKPPALLELSGPGWMSEPCLNHVSFRLEERSGGGGTLVKMRHRAAGFVADGVATDAETIWGKILKEGLKPYAER